MTETLPISQDNGTEPRTAGSQPRGREALFLFNALVVALMTLWILSWGFKADAILDGLYEIQATSLSSGHLYLSPSPPASYYHDSSMYLGRAYLYFGLLPSLGLMILTSLMPRWAAHYLLAGSLVLCFLYFYQRLISEAVDAALESWPGHSYLWRYTPAILLWCFWFVAPSSGPEFTLIGNTFYIYEQQILFGLAVAVPGLYLLVRGIREARASKICAATVMLALAAGIRTTWLLFGCIAILFAGLAIVTMREHGENGRRSGSGWLYLIGSCLLILLLLGVNYLKFGSFTDFGIWFRQNPADDLMFRVSTGFFSIQARLCSFLCNILAYYGCPGMAEALKLDSQSFSVIRPPTASFLCLNPQWLIILVLLPLAVYRVAKVRRALIPCFAVVIFATAYMNVLVAGIPPAAGPRYFMEFYYLLILFLFLSLVALIPYRFAFAVTLVLLAVQFKGGPAESIVRHPNLRLVAKTANGSLELDRRFNRDPGLDLYVVNQAVWPVSDVAADNLSRLRVYNAMGFYARGKKDFLVSDAAAVYVIPALSPNRGTAQSVELRLDGVRATGASGKLEVYLEGLRVGSLNIGRDRESAGCFPIPIALSQDLPYQIMLIFLPDGQDFLPPHLPQIPPVMIKSLFLGFQSKARERTAEKTRKPHPGP